MKAYKLGIDASNIQSGGGLTHLSCLLSSTRPFEFGINKVVVWAGQNVLDQLPEHEWLEKMHEPLLDKGFLARMFWKRFLLHSRLKKCRCDALFAPGTILPPQTISMPTVVLSQNVLPFDTAESSRFAPWHFMRIKMTLLKKIQSDSMKRADGIIFLSRYAKDFIVSHVGCRPRYITTIPHGIGKEFFSKPKSSYPLSNYSLNKPFRILYVSTVDVYKHQWNVAEAVSLLRKKGFPIVVDFVGGAYKPALKRLEKVISKIDSAGDFLCYKGLCKYGELPAFYRQADAFVFASSCENLPNILLEAMASGLPIASSDRGPMPEVLNDSAVYFNPENPEDIELSLQIILEQSKLRYKIACEGHEKAKGYSWKRCADETFSFIKKVIDEKNKELK